MSELILQWSESGRIKTCVISESQPTKVSGVFRLGRDPSKCDLVFRERSVSALHVEIFFRTEQHQTGIRNLRPSNPALVDGRPLTQGEVFLRQGSRINLGRIELLVQSITFTHHSPGPVSPPKLPDYGLKCPNPSCGKVSAYSQETLQQGCPWCGFSLAAAVSVVMLPPSS